MIKNYGLLIPEVTEDQYVLGGFSRVLGELVNPSGDWSSYLPVGERQARAFETFGCTVFGTLNALETLLRQRFGEYLDAAERYPYNIAELKPPGADPHYIAEVIRKNKVIKEELLPFNDSIPTLEEFAKPRPMTQELLNEGKRFLYDIRHEWCLRPGTQHKKKKALLQEALKRGTVCVSVVAWKERNGRYYKEIGEQDGHWVQLVSYGDHPIVNDSYPESEGDFLKDLEDGYDFGMAKVYYLDPSLTPEQKNIFIQILELIKRILRIDQQIIATLPEPIDNVPIEFPEEKQSKYLWDNPINVRHSIRVICDELDMPIYGKNILTAVIEAESGFDVLCNVDGKRVNTNGTRDYSLCQFNDGKNAKGIPYWIGEGADFKDADDVFNNPERQVRVMIREYKRGNLKWWAAYNNLSYRAFL